MLDTAALLRSQPLPHGPAVAVVSNTGGAAVLAADACADAGLGVPRLPPELAAELSAVLPPGAAADNPVVATAAVASDALAACVDRLTEHDAVDTVLVVLVPTALVEATGDDPMRGLTHASMPPAPGPGR
ncbi:hypothetical protein [Streptomyces sp. NPDC018031]|uniref:hypothetical protein n=1 Tax=Streptomyces sp. NPDC018031 TaxID=3365033 RepID=UPI0037916A3A